MLYKQAQREVGDDLGLCVLNLQIVEGKSKSLRHVIKGSCDFMEESFSLYVTTLLDLVAIVIVGIILVCHVISQGHVTL